MKKTININKIKEREVSKKEIEQNEKISKRNKILMYTIPLTLIIMIAIIYILTNNNYLLIPFGAIFLIFLFGWDSNQRTCTECKKWNSIIWTDSKIILKTAKKQKKNVFGKEKIKSVKEKVTRNVGKCKNCGKEITIEKNRKI